MIKNEAEFQQALDQLERMYRALADLRREILPKNPRLFALMAEGPLDYIRQFQAEIDAYVGVTQIEEHEGDLREIDLDSFSFTLRHTNEIEQIQCTFEEGLLDAAKEALDRRVRVTGTRLAQTGRRLSGKLHVRQLVLVEQGNGADMES